MMVLKKLLRKCVPYPVFAIVVLFALYSNLRIIDKEAHRLQNSWRSDEVDYEACLAPIKELIPEGATVGYVTDERMDPLVKSKYLFLTRYALSPLLVVKGGDHPFVIAKHYKIDDRTQGKGMGLVLVKDSCDGVQLYRGEGE